MIEDRKKQEEVIKALKVLGDADIRIGQAFEIVRKRYSSDDLFHIENSKLAKLLKEIL